VDRENSQESPKHVVRLSGDTLLVVEPVSRRFTLYSDTNLIRVGHLRELPAGLWWVNAKIRSDDAGNVCLMFRAIGRAVFGKQYQVPILVMHLDSDA